MNTKKKAIFLLASDWYFWAHWHPLALGVQRAGYEVKVVTPPGKYVSDITRVGLTHVPLEMDRQGRNPLADLSTLKALRALFAKEQPDIVHNIALKPILYGTLAAQASDARGMAPFGKSKRVGIVNTMPGMGYVFLNPQLLSRSIRPFMQGFFRASLWAKNCRLVLLNRSNRDKWLEWGASPDRTRLIGGAGIALDRFPFSEEGGGVPLVVLPARLLFDKGVREFIEAVRMLRARKVQARFALVGEPDLGNPASVTRDDMNGWEKEGLVELFGWRDDMAKVYAEAAIVCLPSYGEGIPQSLVEALACGRPVVASDVPGCHDVVREGDNGLLVPVRTTEPLAAALEKLIGDRETRQKMGKRGRQIAESEYAIAKIVEKHLALYEELT
jgi:glycosyltransferase involved in cell wall biosynthesis